MAREDKPAEVATHKGVPHVKSPPADAQPIRPSRVPYRELASSEKEWRRWRAVVIPKDLPIDKLVAVAREWHEWDPQSSVRFFDDDSRYEEFRLWDEHYPNPQFPSPEGWAERHYIALLNKVSDRAGERWELWAMDGLYDRIGRDLPSQVIAVFPVAPAPKPVAKRDDPASRSPATGDVAVMNTDMIVAADEASYDLMLKYARASDAFGLTQMEAAGQIMILPRGTKVLVIDGGILPHTIRILDGRYAGRRAIAPPKFVNR